MNILGIHGGVTINQHDPAAALICNGKIVAVCEEERFTRVKTPKGSLPIYAIKACLKEAKLKIQDIDLVIHPGETYEDMPARIKLYFEHYFGHCPKVELLNHQTAHLASAFFCSGFDKALCLSYDNVGDRLSLAWAIGENNSLKIMGTNGTEKSLGVFYAVMTSYLGFEVNEGEYKVMGLAAYGQPGIDLSPFLKITDSDFSLNKDYVLRDPPHKCSQEPYYNQKLIELLGPARAPGTPITQRHKDIAYATQKMLEQAAIVLIKSIYSQAPSENLCLAGGVALNCSCNLGISQLPFIKNLFVQPAASDRGLAFGCALYGAAMHGMKIGKLEHVSLGPSYLESEIESTLKLVGADYSRPADICAEVAKLIAEGKIVGWWQGRSEYGPRALGNRSILADPRPASMKDEVNARIKFREEFRPFAPAVTEERSQEIFEMKGPSPFMTVAFPVKPEWRTKLAAITHANNTARVQTVSSKVSPLFHGVIRKFGEITGVPVVMNTSFNVKGQPIVETPLDALGTFASCGMDALCIGPFLMKKPHAPVK